MKKKVIILGAGISGLSAAYALRQRFDITIIEKEASSGGWCEKAARTFRSSSCEELLALANELGLEKEILACAPDARNRYLFFQGKLEKIPTSPIDFFRSPLLRGIRWGLLSEWKKPICQGDETLFDFAKRRFGQEAALRLFDAISIGVFAADSQKISIETAFPALKEMEKNYGSLLKAFLFKKKSRNKNLPALFSFRGGTKTLIKGLIQKLEGALYHQEEALGIKKEGSHLEVLTTRGTYKADGVIIALPPRTAGRILNLRELEELEMTSLCMVHLEYENDVLPLKGFGYLVPSREHLPLLGVIFDSCIFPSENKAMQTRLTVMLPSLENPKEAAISFAREHLKIMDRPSLVEETMCEEAIFLPRIGHRKKMQEVLDSLDQNLMLAGNYLDGVSVNDCVRSGFNAARKLQDVLKS